MNEQAATRQQLDQLRAEADLLQAEEKRARVQLAEVHRQFQAAMRAYRTIALRQQQVERLINKLLAKDTRLYVQTQKK